MNWRTPKEHVPIYDGQFITPVFFDEVVGVPPTGAAPSPMLLVVRTTDVDFDDFIGTVNTIKPYSVVAPFDTNNASWTSRAAERALTNVKDSFVGVVIAGRSSSERLDFTVWAQQQGYAPLVLLPHGQKTRMRQINEYNIQGYIEAPTWVHLAGRCEEALDTSYFKGLFTMGGELWQ